MFADFPRPSVVVSKCLGFKKCRYNGQTIPDRFVERLGDYVDYITVCPEEEIDLGTPRDPVRIGRRGDEIRMVQPASGADYTDKMLNFVSTFLDGVESADGFLMKNRSPSCGINDVKIYQNLDKPTGAQRGKGLFGGSIADYFPEAAIEDEGRLRNFSIREHFLTKLFANTRFRKISNGVRMKDLVDFHSSHKYLFMAYNETAMRECGKIVANYEHFPAEEVFRLYREKMRDIFVERAKYTSIINTLYHIFGGVSDNLSGEEKKFFLDSAEQYRDERIPLSAILQLLKSYVIRFDNEYLKRQVFLNPYPEKLVEISDSGKGRSY
ncbi:MAG: DUF523 and DUF1722 domain-containing protein [Candidatus Krumholzibacteriota bacterium]|nr:DUF523 and DUF1722 domain-containing protein [Candidatus Krumholzibacteriota bacterium]